MCCVCDTCVVACTCNEGGAQCVGVGSPQVGVVGVVGVVDGVGVEQPQSPWDGVVDGMLGQPGSVGVGVGCEWK